MDGWADNWFAAYLGETLLVEDSVSITTVRSFNAETVTFRADYPLHLNLILKDYKENETVSNTSAPAGSRWAMAAS